MENVLALLLHKNSTLEERDSTILHLLHDLGVESSQRLIQLRTVMDSADYSGCYSRMLELLALDACFTLDSLAVRGTDLLEAGICPGPAVGNALNALLEAVMDGKCANSKEQLLKYLQNV